MNIYLSNFARRVGDFISQNRARLIRWLLILAGAVLVVALIYYGVERLQRWRYEQHVQALEKQFRDADARAKEAQARADAKQKEIDAKESELRELELRASAADAALRAARTAVAPLKEKYEEARNTPIDPADTSCADACTELAAVDHPCR
ncbi:MAG TPA: hypothetical protein VH985_11465 [Candidatus Binatia bacterium]|jgi:uncharacterized protein HemX